MKTRTPSEIYLLTLQSTASRKTMNCLLDRCGNILQGQKKHALTDWSIIHYEDILDLLSTLSGEGKAPSTINTYLSALKGVARETWRQKAITAEHYQHIQSIKRVKGSRAGKGRALSSEELNSLIDSCLSLKTALGARDAALIGLIYGAGLRRQECADLHLSDINIQKQTVKISGKGNKERVNDLHDKTIFLLSHYLRARGMTSGALFYRGLKSGELLSEGISSQAIYDILARRQSNIGLEHMTPHDLRRTYATNLLEMNQDVFTVQALMGHADVATTRTYDMRDKTTQKKAVQTLPF